MEVLMRFRSSARPYVDDIQKEFARHWNNEEPPSEANSSLAGDMIESESSAIGQLPVEIQHTICSFMTSRDLVRLSQVSSSWNSMCNDEVHWKRAFDSEKIRWDSIQSCNKTNLSMWEKFARASSNVTDLWAYENSGNTPQQSAILPPPKWKTTFLLNHLANPLTKTEAALSLNSDIAPPPPPHPSLGNATNLGEFAHAIKTNAPALASMFASKLSPVVGQLKVPFKKIHRIPMLGEGLESTSKDLLYSMMWPQNSPMFSVTCLYPGVEGIGSGVGFCIDNVNLNIAALHRCHLDDLRLKWREYFQRADGVIYVVSCKNMPKKPVRRQLELIVSGEDPLVLNKMPLLVLLVCDDPLASKIRPSELADQLGLENLDRPWFVQLVDMSTLKGLPEGLRWLAHKV